MKSPNRPDLRVVDSAEEYVAESERRLKSGGGDGTFGDMEARVKALETKFDRIDGKLDGLVKDVAEIKGKISNMPATWQIVTICASLIAITIAAGVGALAIARTLGAG